MELWHTFALAIIQGLTEFLPISSSAHLILPSQVLGWSDQGLGFDVAVHVGTLLAVVWYFRQDVMRLTGAWFSDTAHRRLTEDSRLAWAIIVATIPAGLAGIALEHVIETQLRSALVIAIATIGFGVVLWWADVAGKREKGLPSLGWRDAVLIGLAQALALIPGTSRSGITMTAALFLGYQRDAAARFSFLLSIPLIIAAGLLKSIELAQTGTESQWADVLIGAGVSFVSALLCIHLFLRFLEKLGFLPYVIYRLLLGAVLLLVVL
ncbi:undecaprenyl-diphosphate phosphatase [Marinobacter sp. NFXS9]|uniref:undecaprenyl-diphosphate phosphatase n=1 Tax=Marinobacter sp. NFXS9 TaxID=2818433 RepID=UPI0032DF6B15